MILSRDAILAAIDRERIEVEVPEWGGSVFIDSISALEFADVAKLISDERPDLEVMGALLAKCLVNADGERLFDDEGVADLLDKNAHIVIRLGNLALEHNRVTDDAMDDAAKN